MSHVCKVPDVVGHELIDALAQQQTKIANIVARVVSLV